MARGRAAGKPARLADHGGLAAADGPGSQRAIAADPRGTDRGSYPQSELLGPPADAEVTDSDDSLALLFGCCHPDLSSPSQIALTLRAVGGLSTAQIAAAFGVPEATMAQRISRAKQTISGTGFDFSLPVGAERTERLRAVLHVLYLIFNGVTRPPPGTR